MSDTVLKVIPAPVGHVPPLRVHQEALDLLVRLVPSEHSELRIHAELQYIDAGEYEEGAECPRCGRQLCFDWSPEHEQEMDWYREMIQRTEQSAEGAITAMPCCGNEVPFSEVRFHHSGFALFELIADNPDVDYPLNVATHRQLEATLGCQLRQIWARY